MASPTIPSLAILTVNWEDEKKGYHYNFLPFLAESIRRNGSDVISVNDVHKTVLAEFGLRLPINIIRMLMPYLEKQGYIQLQPATNPPDEDKSQTLNTYTPNWAKLQELNFGQIQQDVLRQHEELIESFISFCAKKYSRSFGAEEAEEGLLSFLKESGLHTISIARDSVIPPTQDQPQKNARYLVGAFIQYLQDTSSSILPYLDTVARGYMLANAVFLLDVKNRPQKFRYTQVYFDTQFLLFALGYGGEARREPCNELLALLREEGALLRCFRHTLQETDGILYAHEGRMLHGELDDLYGPLAEHFLAQQYRASDIERFRQKLEKDLDKLGILVADKPAYVIAPYQIDEEQLELELRKAIFYRSPVARQRDVDSISAIMRLRKGVTSRQIEDCKALFVTTNANLARTAREFCHREFDPLAIIPPCLTDHVVTTLVWLKKPLERPNLPMKRIIADCYAATQPDDRLWAKYIAEIKRLEQVSSGEVTPEDYISLKYTTVARSSLMELTLGDADALTVGTVPEILKRVRLKHQEEVLAELEEQRRLRQEEKKAEDARQERVRQRAQKVAHILANIIKWGLWIVLVAGAFYAISGGSPLSQTSILRSILSIVAGLIAAFAIINLMHNTPLDAVINRFEKYVAAKIEQWLRNLTR